MKSEFSTAEWLAAFRVDPVGTDRKLAPVRVRECEPRGLLGSIVYCDLVGLDEDQAKRRLLACVSRRRGKPPQEPVFPNKPQPAFPEPEASSSSAGGHAIFGLDGAPLDRSAANYMWTRRDAALRDNVDRHESYGVVLVSGAPGQGKTWSLARLGIDAAPTHDVCSVDIAYAAQSGVAEDALVAVVDTLRRTHQRCYREIERFVLDGVRSWGAQELDPGVLPAVLADQMKAAGLLNVSTRTRLDALDVALRRIQSAAGPNALRRYSANHGDGDPPGIAYVRPLRGQYVIDDLADDISLLVALSDAYALLSAATAGEAAVPPARKLLLLVDNPDRADGCDMLLQALRGLQPLVRFYPLLQRVLVVAAKTERSARRAVASSTLVRWYRLLAFTNGELTDLVGVLMTASWVPGDWPADTVVERCMALGGGNRRVTCLYLDHCASARELLAIGAYLKPDQGGDLRLSGLLGAWAAQASHALMGVDRDCADDVKHWLEQVRDATAATVEPAILESAPANAAAFAETFGLARGTWVPVVQQLVCQRILDNALGHADRPVHGGGR